MEDTHHTLGRAIAQTKKNGSVPMVWSALVLQKPLLTLVRPSERHLRRREFRASPDLVDRHRLESPQNNLNNRPVAH
jgi:hypothetical protein